MPNRSMQVKHIKASAQRAAIMQDVLARETYRDTTAVETVVLEDIVAAYKGRVTVIKSTPSKRRISGRTMTTCQALRRASAIARNC